MPQKGSSGSRKGGQHSRAIPSPLVHKMLVETKAFDDVEVFVRDILAIDWLWPMQWEMFFHLELLL